MANVYINLPMPALNGAGASVATITMGGAKSIVVSGDFGNTTLTVEASVDGGTVWAPVAVFQTGGSLVQVVEVACDFMRVNVSGRNNIVPFSAVMDVGANDTGAVVAVIPMPAGNGSGASVNVSALGSFNTFIVGGSFDGATVLIEASEDGASWGPVVQFAGQGGIFSKVIVAEFYRATVSGRRNPVPFTATASVGAINDSSGGGGSGNPQIFQYVATGLEGSDFTVTLPAPRASDSYRVFCQQDGVADILAVDCPDILAGDRTVNDFRVVTTAAVTAGDQFVFFVSDDV